MNYEGVTRGIKDIHDFIQNEAKEKNMFLDQFKTKMEHLSNILNKLSVDQPFLRLKNAFSFISKKERTKIEKDLICFFDEINRQARLQGIKVVYTDNYLQFYNELKEYLLNLKDLINLNVVFYEDKYFSRLYSFHNHLKTDGIKHLHHLNYIEYLSFLIAMDVNLYRKFTSKSYYYAKTEEVKTEEKLKDLFFGPNKLDIEKAHKNYLSWIKYAYSKYLIWNKNKKYSNEDDKNNFLHVDSFIYYYKTWGKLNSNFIETLEQHNEFHNVKKDIINELKSEIILKANQL